MKSIYTPVIVLILLLPEGLPAQAGSLDSTFNLDGIVTTDFFNNGEQALSVVIQPDGKILVAGSVESGMNVNFALARYHTDGSLDPGFGTDGKTHLDFAGRNDFVRGMVLRPNGKIILGGYVDNGIVHDFALAQFNADGTLDTGFGTDGKVITVIGSAESWMQSIAIQPDGKILAAGFSETNTKQDFTLARYNADGTLDSDFGTTGITTTDFNQEGDNAYSVILQSDGKIIVAGTSDNGTNDDFALARYHPDGMLDISFGIGGLVTTDFGMNFREEGRSVVLQPDGKIILAGYANTNINTNFDFALARYHPDGTLDNSFGTNGIQTNPVYTENDFGWAAALQTDGKIIVVGSSFRNFNREISLARYNPDGSLDTGFGMDGTVITSVGTGQDAAVSVAIQTDEKIVVAGYAEDDTFESRDWVVVRYLSDLDVGTVDFSLSENSVLVYPNPVAHTVFLEYTLLKEESVSIQLFETQGKILKSFIENNKQDKGKHYQKIDLPDKLPSGCYYIVLSTPDGRVSIKIVK